MKTLRIAQAALAMILAVGINSTSHAFMAVPVDQTAAVQMDVTEMVDSFRKEIAAGQTSCEDMLAKLDAALKDIDAKLDAGVANEEAYLTARDDVAKMRYELECVAKELAHDVLDPNGAAVLHGHDIGGGGLASGTFAPGSTLSGGGSFSTGASAGTDHGGGLGALLFGGTIAGIASDNNSRGFIASESVAD